MQFYASGFLFLERLFGGLLYKVHLRVLVIQDTPIETVDEHTFLGVNKTLNEIHMLNTSLAEFPKLAFKVSTLC